jgi:LPXTG-motif cell wall-anchored protein
MDTVTMIRVAAGVLAVVILGIIIMRRRRKATE